MKRLISLVLLGSALVVTSAASAQQTTKPIRYTWIPVTVTEWKDVAVQLAAANGDGTVIALPTGDEARPWVVLKRVEEGSVYVPDDEPRVCTLYDLSSEAIAGYSAVAPCRKATLLVVPDGRHLMVSLRECGARRRPAGQ